MGDTRLLVVDDLRVDYVLRDRTVHAVNTVTFELHEGEILGLVGESGSGKSAVLRSIIGLLPPDTSRTGGQIVYKNQNLLGLPKADMRKIAGAEISMVFQDPMTHLNPVMRIHDQIEEVLRRHLDLSSTARHDRVIELMRLVGVSDAEARAKDYPHQFSGGMRQRVLIAIALACNPQVLLADEPTTALDVTVQAQILALLRGIRSTRGTSVIFVSHDLATVAQICDTVAVMYAGEIVEQAPVRTFLDDPRHPYSIGLMDAVPREKNRERYLAAIPGVAPDVSHDFTGCRFADRCGFVQEECRTWETEMLGVDADHRVRCRRHEYVDQWREERDAATS